MQELQILDSSKDGVSNNNYAEILCNSTKNQKFYGLGACGLNCKYKRHHYNYVIVTLIILANKKFNSSLWKFGIIVDEANGEKNHWTRISFVKKQNKADEESNYLDMIQFASSRQKLEKSKFWLSVNVQWFWGGRSSCGCDLGYESNEPSSRPCRNWPNVAAWNVKYESIALEIRWAL